MGKNEVKIEKYVDRVNYERPTIPVRVRPYIFLFESNFYTLNESVAGGNIQVQKFLPQGNLAEGNRVTWGHRIILIKSDPSVACIVNFQGVQVNIPIGLQMYELIDTTKNTNGVDKTQYTLFSVLNTFQIHHIEQILVKSPM